jgi:hypothetical protein
MRKISRHLFCILPDLPYLCKVEEIMKLLMTREEAQKRFETARQKKRDCLTRLEKNMKEEYEKRTGKTADYFFAL